MLTPLATTRVMGVSALRTNVRLRPISRKPSQALTEQGSDLMILRSRLQPEQQEVSAGHFKMAFCLCHTKTTQAYFPCLLFCLNGHRKGRVIS